MYAVVQTGGKQYRVSEGEKFKVEKLEVSAGETVTLENVLLLGGVEPMKIGTPSVKDVSVTCEVIEQGRHDKILVFKKIRRKRFQRTYGHRQPFTLLKVTSINAPGVTKVEPKAASSVVKKKPSKKKAPKKGETRKTTTRRTTEKRSVKK